MPSLTVEELRAMIDHSVIDPYSTEADLIKGVALVREYRVGQFVSQPFRVKQAKELLEGCPTRLLTYVGFPLGADHTSTKVEQTHRACDEGVDELDMVINISALLSGDYDYVEKDIAAIVKTAAPYGVGIKAIIETHCLRDAQKVTAAKIAEAAGVLMVKTATGTRPTWRNTEEIRLLRASVGPAVTIKASGAVWDIDGVLAYYEAGARRFGMHATDEILDDLAARNAAGLADGYNALDVSFLKS